MRRECGEETLTLGLVLALGERLQRGLQRGQLFGRSGRGHLSRHTPTKTRGRKDGPVPMRTTISANTSRKRNDHGSIRYPVERLGRRERQGMRHCSIRRTWRRVQMGCLDERQEQENTPRNTAPKTPKKLHETIPLHVGSSVVPVPQNQARIFQENSQARLQAERTKARPV